MDCLILTSYCLHKCRMNFRVRLWFVNTTGASLFPFWKIVRYFAESSRFQNWSWISAALVFVENGQFPMREWTPESRYFARWHRFLQRECASAALVSSQIGDFEMVNDPWNRAWWSEPNETYRESSSISTLRIWWPRRSVGRLLFHTNAPARSAGKENDKMSLDVIRSNIFV